MEQKKRSLLLVRYYEELDKCANKPVDVYSNGKVFSGILLGCTPVPLNAVIMTPTDKIIIKNVSHIVRKREHQEVKNGRRTENSQNPK